ncbi:hypothetical protein [Niallia circulans]|uniref:hypothetical protein n=1 Tax=Niallia circulans TaxID=1397 RepID=UPI0015609A8C|nr:hypothetical protein [Niallia circulans]NRG33926.1 hypothetical protein [Niallia circulans]
MKQFRTVKRRAKVGERILITNKSEWEHRYKNGSVGEVFGVDVRSVFVQFAGVNAGVDHCEYEVIEEVNPKEENEMETKQLTDYSYEELLDAIKAKAQAEVRKITIDGKEIANAITSFGGAAKSTGVTSAELLARVNSHRTPQQQRDEIIEQAKRDVAELLNEYQISDKELEFSRKDSSVQAIIRHLFSGMVLTKGIAKCAPTDCFNVHIGKAIALRRALGLEVPSEYLNAPQPTEVRVGDTIRYTDPVMQNETDTVVSIKKGIYGVEYRMKSGGFDWRYNIDIIDDSREGE